LSTTLDPLCGLPGYVASGFYPQLTASIRFIVSFRQSVVKKKKCARSLAVALP
jgi:NAD-dependent oxidoreductase involved in siderophore biosynthesis